MDANLTIKPSLTTFDFSLIFIENKCFSDGIWNLKREKNNFAKRWIRTQVALYVKV